MYNTHIGIRRKKAHKKCNESYDIGEWLSQTIIYLNE